MELQNGRPENIDNRLDKEVRVYDFLDKLGIAYQRVDHEAAMTMEACEKLTALSETIQRSVKTFFCAIVRKQIFICYLCQEINHLKQKICPHRFILPDCPLPNQNIWKNILILLPDLSASWD